MRNLIVIYLLFLGFQPLFGQSKPKILVAAEYWTPAQKNFLKDNKIKGVTVVYEMYFTNDGKTFNKNKLTNLLNTAIPNKNDTGYAVLDWEGANFVKLIGEAKTTDEEYQQILNEFISALDYAKKLRPNIKWSFFNFSPSAYPVMNQTLEKQYSRLSPLISRLDFYAPALYLQDDVGANKDKIIKYLYTNLKSAIVLNTKNKEILPFIWHRYHNAKEDNYLINDLDFKWYIEKILQTTYNKKKIQGVIWWNSESYLSQLPKKSAKLEKEFSLQKNNSNYQYQILDKYFKILDLIRIR